MGAAMLHADPATTRAPAGHVVSRPHDPAERQAAAAATTVAAGGSVADWSFLAVTPRTLHRDHHDRGGDAPTPPDLDQSDEYEEAAVATGRALLETEPVKRVIAEVRSDPAVRAVEDALTSDPAKITYGALAVGAVGAGIGATVARGGAARDPADEVRLPFQMPMVPVTGPWSARIVWEGPVDMPTFAGVAIRYQPSGGGTGDRDRNRAGEEARAMAVDQARFRESMRTPEERRREQEWMARQMAARLALPTIPTVVVPFGDAQPQVVPPSRFRLEPPSLLQPRGRRMPSLLDDDELDLGPVPTLPPTPVLRDARADRDDRGDERSTGHVDLGTALAGPGRPLDATVRSAMETAFGWDFSQVRLHADSSAVAAADDLGARAFTTGTDVVAAPHAIDPRSTPGRRTLAHELAHVVQGGGGRRLTARGGDVGGVERRDAAHEEATP